MSTFDILDIIMVVLVVYLVGYVVSALVALWLSWGPLRAVAIGMLWFLFWPLYLLARAVQKNSDPTK